MSVPGPLSQSDILITSRTDSSLTGSQSSVPQTKPDLMMLLAHGVVKCGICNSVLKYSPTESKDSVIQCLNMKCKSFICTLDGCWKSYQQLPNVISHQKYVHLRNADPNKCNFCKAKKHRTGTTEVGHCTNCGMHWCLFKDCTYETQKLSSLTMHQTHARHRYCYQ